MDPLSDVLMNRETGHTTSPPPDPKGLPPAWQRWAIGQKMLAHAPQQLAPQLARPFAPPGIRQE